MRCNYYSTLPGSQRRDPRRYVLSVEPECSLDCDFPKNYSHYSVTETFRYHQPPYTHYPSIRTTISGGGNSCLDSLALTTRVYTHPPSSILLPSYLLIARQPIDRMDSTSDKTIPHISFIYFFSLSCARRQRLVHHAGIQIQLSTCYSQSCLSWPPIGSLCFFISFHVSLDHNK